MIRGRTRSLGLLLLGLVAVCWTSATAWAVEPTEFVKEKAFKVSRILNQRASKKRAKKLESELQKTVDFAELAAKSLGEHWVARTDAEKREFLELLQQLLQANYQSKLEGKKVDKDYKIEYVEEKTRGEKAIVKTVVSVDADKTPVQYKLVRRGDTWIAFDVVIDDIGLVESYREEYTEIIEAEGWAKLIEKMRARIKELEEAQKK
ncbi:MAG: ABC transporter substrate-binding protein [Myxococcota bacterium]